MDTNDTCPKCGGELDTGSIEGFGAARYLSDNAKATFMHAPGVHICAARACVDCGYMELYINTQELLKDLSPT